MTVGEFNRSFKGRSINLIARFLAWMCDDDLDRAYKLACRFQHREGDGWYKNNEGHWQQCRIQSTEWDDPIMRESGCSSEIYGDFMRRDLADGCPFCGENLAENASEPDVMARWGFR